MTYYLLEWSYNDEEDAEIFSSLDYLTESLRLDMEDAHERTGTFEILYLGIYERGTLSPLLCLLKGEAPEMDDFLDQHYEICQIRDTQVETLAEFTVRIDRRRQ